MGDGHAWRRTAPHKNGCTCLSLRSACWCGTHTHFLAAICFPSPISTSSWTALQRIPSCSPPIRGVLI
ncbi:hypothetical protein CKAH01_09914 [Colletotrichum kahawae]|uniref:Uncharacterized protein n=1 Tax=Colletotrichum kahawae TaxID=34407 RepID=A0AAE0CY54_COLKA|nr:hypothetical protein CKAH01_09914 [Colletotrichum kahawae]